MALDEVGFIILKINHFTINLYLSGPQSMCRAGFNRSDAGEYNREIYNQYSYLNCI